MKLLNYKGKFGIAVDDLYELDDQDVILELGYPRETFLKELPYRHKLARYYGVPVYIGTDEEINNIIKKLDVEYDMEYEI